MKLFKYSVLAATFLISFPALAAAKDAKHIEKIQIEDITFRVVVTGDTAKVASTGSAWFAPVGARYFALARKAVEQVSGCKVTQTDNFRATMYASLDCEAHRAGDGTES